MGGRSRSRSGGRGRSRSPRRSRRSPSYRSVSRGRDRSKSRSAPPKKRSRSPAQETREANPVQDLDPALKVWKRSTRSAFGVFITFVFLRSILKLQIKLQENWKAPKKYLE